MNNDTSCLIGVLLILFGTIGAIIYADSKGVYTIIDLIPILENDLLSLAEYVLKIATCLLIMTGVYYISMFFNERKDKIVKFAKKINSLLKLNNNEARDERNKM